MPYARCGTACAFFGCVICSLLLPTAAVRLSAPTLAETGGKIVVEAGPSSASRLTPRYYIGVVHGEAAMGVPISIRLDDDVRDALEAQAKASGIGLATLLRELATKAAREAKRARIYAESAAIGERVTASESACAFYKDVGTPTSNVG